MTVTSSTPISTPIEAPRRTTPRVLWSRVLRPGAGGPWPDQVGDAAFRTFLTRRLCEERTAAGQRLLGAPDPDTALRALRLLDELIDDLDHGVLPDETTLQVLTTVHAGHPDCRREWLSSTLHATPTGALR